MSDLVQDVSAWTSEQAAKASSDASSTTKTTSNEMGKDQFLQLLVTQMKYQDPLSPSSDTDFIAQLAQFSSLEQMQNLNQTSVNSQAFNLVGKEVIVSTKDALGKATQHQGTVDYVVVESGKAKISIGGTLYSTDDLVQVMDDFYAIQDKLPSAEAQEVAYDKAKPADVKIKIDLGEDAYQASSVAVGINGSYVDSSKMSYEDGVLTINSEVLKDLAVGKYDVSLVFNDPLTTSVTDKVSINVSDSSVEA